MGVNKRFCTVNTLFFFAILSKSGYAIFSNAGCVGRVRKMSSFTRNFSCCAIKEESRDTMRKYVLPCAKRQVFVKIHKMKTNSTPFDFLFK